MTSPDKASAITGDWECTACGLVEEGLDSQRPESCPECGAPANALVFHVAETDRWEEIDEEDDESDLSDDDLDDDERDDFDEDEPLEEDEEA